MNDYYYVLLLGPGNWAAIYQQIADVGEQAMRASRERLCAAHDLSVILTSIQCEMHAYFPEYDEQAPAEYRRFAFVLFLNEGAMQMLREAGMTIRYDTVIPGDELPRLTQATAGYYLP
jgi:hypothetical protein